MYGLSQWLPRPNLGHALVGLLVVCPPRKQGIKPDDMSYMWAARAHTDPGSTPRIQQLYQEAQAMNIPMTSRLGWGLLRSYTQVGSRTDSMTLLRLAL